MSQSQTVRTMYALAQRKAGVSSNEAVEATGRTIRDVQSYLKWMADTGRLTKRRVKEGRTRARFHADPAVHLVDLERRLAAANRASKAAQVAASNLATKGLLALPRDNDGTRVEWRVIDGRRVKVTVCAVGEDTRFTVKPSDVAPLFGCLGFGRYLQRDSAIARAYGSGA